MGGDGGGGGREAPPAASRRGVAAQPPAAQSSQRVAECRTRLGAPTQPRSQGDRCSPLLFSSSPRLTPPPLSQVIAALRSQSTRRALLSWTSQAVAARGLQARTAFLRRFSLGRRWLAWKRGVDRHSNVSIERLVLIAHLGGLHDRSKMRAQLQLWAHTTAQLKGARRMSRELGQARCVRVGASSAPPLRFRLSPHLSPQLLSSPRLVPGTRCTSSGRRTPRCERRWRCWQAVRRGESRATRR